jgi:hypothetical protein
MCADEQEPNSFEEMLRDIAREVSDSVERTMEQVDVEGVAETIGIDPDRAREWVDTAAGILRAQAERFGDEVADRAAKQHPVPAEPPTEDPLRHAGPHPLDVPTEEQGLALAALDSGRWTVEPGSNALAAHGEGPGPNDALGLVRELHARDWITSDGEVTLVGQHALGRWLDSKPQR